MSRTHQIIALLEPVINIRHDKVVVAWRWRVTHIVSSIPFVF
jgi:hypothetical protein